MGHFLSRHASVGQEEIELSSHAYRFPPPAGCSFFGSHFMMGGEKFETIQPECYLFGDNADLNFIGTKVVPFPYCPLLPNAKPIVPICCTVAIRRDSLKFIRVMNNNSGELSSGCLMNPSPSTTITDYKDDQSISTAESFSYQIQFVFDSDCSCEITIYYYAYEKMDASGLRYISKKPELTSKSYRFDVGAGQIFRPNDYFFQMDAHQVSELQYATGSDCVPIVVHLVSISQDPANTSVPQSHAIWASVDKSAEGNQGFVLKVLKQKHFVDGVCYLMQELYGIENKHGDVGSSDVCGSAKTSSNLNQLPSSTDDDSFQQDVNSGMECVVCMCESRDTVILPCRHLCLCSACAETLRYKASNCPICRSPFKALLQIKTLQRLRRPPTVHACNDSSCVTRPSTSLDVGCQLSNSFRSVDHVHLDMSHQEMFTTPLSIQQQPQQQQQFQSSSNYRYVVVPLMDALNGITFRPSHHSTMPVVVRPRSSSHFKLRSTTTRLEQEHPFSTGNCSTVDQPSPSISSTAVIAPPRHSQQQHHRHVRSTAGGNRRSHHRRKRQLRPHVPIQEVLTLQSLNHHHKNALMESPVVTITTKTPETQPSASSSVVPITVDHDEKVMDPVNPIEYHLYHDDYSATPLMDLPLESLSAIVEEEGTYQILNNVSDQDDLEITRPYKCILNIDDEISSSLATIQNEVSFLNLDETALSSVSSNSTASNKQLLPDEAKNIGNI